MDQQILAMLPGQRFQGNPGHQSLAVFYGCSGLIAEVNKIIRFVHLLQQRPAKFRRSLNTVWSPFKTATFNRMDALVGQKQP